MTEPSKTVDLETEFSGIHDHWRPKVVAALNGQEVKIAKVKGEFVWHHHDDEDELFLVHKGTLRIELRDGEIVLGPGQMAVVPRGVEHKPVAEEEVEMLLFEPSGVRNTGNVEHEQLTAP